MKAEKEVSLEGSFIASRWEVLFITLTISLLHISEYEMKEKTFTYMRNIE